MARNLNTEASEEIFLRRPPGLVAACMLLLVVALLLGAFRLFHSAGRGPPLRFADASCATCHAAEFAAWRGSHHALAMQIAAPGTVRGDFANVTVADKGPSVRFFREAGRFKAAVDGLIVTVAATFGVYPLQQYLAEMPGGRLQVLPLAWDTRPAEAGGQRWFNPSPDRAPDWRSRDATWNFMCAACHSTGVRKNYDLATDSYRTNFDAENVACAACHGDTSAHEAWARNGATMAAEIRPSTVFPADAGHWGAYDALTGIRHWQGTPRAGTVLNVCAPCHSRRRPLTDDARPDTVYLDAYEPSLLDPVIYQADGQINDEDFEYGSFLQSRMAQAGVRCTDCHDAHSLNLRAIGNALCAQCHSPARFDAVSHTHHDVGSAGAACIACHMPSRTYMGVHVRHDHGFRVPHPELDRVFGTTDSCTTTCHRGKDGDWAATVITGWRGGAPVRKDSSTALAAARMDAGQARQTAADPSLPGIVRATALSLLGKDAADEAILLSAANDEDGLVRFGAARASGGFAEAALGKLLNDTVLAVRVNAARALAGTPAAEKPLAEWKAAEKLAADRPETHANLGGLYADLGDLPHAKAAFATALRLDPEFVPALIDLGDVGRLEHDERASETWLRRAVAAAPDNETAWYALGLCLVRQHRAAEASDALRRAGILR